MKKRTVLWAVLDLIFILVFNLCFFLLSKPGRPASVWVAYVFIHLSYLSVLAMPFLNRPENPAVLGLSLYAVSAVYFLVEFIVGLIILFLRPQRIVASLLVQVVLAAVYVAVLVINLLANDHTADELAGQTEQAARIKDMASRVRLLTGRLPDRDVDSKIQRIYDLLHASPAASPASAADVERRLSDGITRLEEAVNAKNAAAAASLCDELQALIQERALTVKRSYR